MPKLPNISKRNILPVLSLLVLILSIVMGVVLIQQEQDVRIKAWDCTNYRFEVSQIGVVSTLNGSTSDEPAQLAQVFIDGVLTDTLDVPALKAGDAATIGAVSVPESGTFSWQVIGTSDCEDSGSYEGGPTPTLAPTTTPIVTPTITPGCPLAPYGDIDCNGVIDIIDYQILSNNFGTGHAASDLDGSGIVDILDFQILSNNFGKSG